MTTTITIEKTDDKLEALRKWVQAEIEYETASNEEEGSDGYGRSSRTERDHAENCFQTLKGMFDTNPTEPPATVFKFELGEVVKYHNIDNVLVSGEVISRTEHIGIKPTYGVARRNLQGEIFDGNSNVPEHKLNKC